MSAPTISITRPFRTTDSSHSVPVYDGLLVTGSSASGQNIVRIDLNKNSVQIYNSFQTQKFVPVTVQSYGILEVYCDPSIIDTDQEAPVAPGSSKTITVKVALSDTDVLPSDAPVSLANVLATTLVCSLADDTTSKLVFRSDPFVVPSRFVYVWQDNTALATHSVVAVDAKLVRVQV